MTIQTPDWQSSNSQLSHSQVSEIGKIIDTHCHLDFPVFDDDRDVILKNCQDNNIDAIVVPGVNHKNWQRVISLSRQYEIIHPALGLHPCFLHEHQADDLDKLAQLCDTESLVAIGEIGLDFYDNKRHKKPVDEPDREIDRNLVRDQQRHYFSEQLQIARQYQLPVLIHARKSHDEVIQYLKAAQLQPGIIHAFSGSYEQAREYLKLGFKLGFGGAYTYPKASKLRSLLLRLPLDAWVLETDAPDMSPVDHHGERNSPLYLTEIAQEFISLYTAEPASEKIIMQLHHNTRDVFSTI